jgi:hypothetical protein
MAFLEDIAKFGKDLISPGRNIQADTSSIKKEQKATKELQGELAKGPEEFTAPTVDTTNIPKVAPGITTAPTVADKVTSVKTADVMAAGQNVNQAVDMARQAALGQAPSFAEQLLKQQGDKALAQQASLMAGKSFDPAAVRQAQNLGAQAQMEAGAQAAGVRAQEMATARQEFARAAEADRGAIMTMSQADVQNKLTGMTADQQAALQQSAQALQASGMNADIALKTALADQTAKLTSMGINANMQQAYLNGRISLQQALLGSQGTAAQLQTQAGIGAAQANQAATAALLGGGASMGAAAIAASDINLKKNIKGSDNASSWLDALEAYNYNYKKGVQDTDASKEYTSVMAQDLEKAGPVGKQMVKEGPQGKMVDYGQGFAGMLAAMVDMNKRLKKVEK